MKQDWAQGKIIGVTLAVASVISFFGPEWLCAVTIAFWMLALYNKPA